MSTNNSNAEVSKKKTIKMILMIVCSVASFFGCIPILRLLLNNNVDINLNLAEHVLKAVLASIPFVIFGGAKWLKPDIKAVGKSLLFCLPLFIFNSILFLMQYFALKKSGFAGFSASGVLFSILIVFLVGVNEELAFRGLMNGGLMIGLGKKKNGMLIAAVISSLYFGYVHVFTLFDFSKIYVVVSCLLKIIQVGMFGFVLCYLYIKHKNFWGVIIVHAIFDWFSLSLSLIGTGEISASYASDDQNTSIIFITMYLVMILLYTPNFVLAVKGFKKLEPTEEPFWNDSSDKQ